MCVKPLVLYKLQAFSPTPYWLKQLRKLQKHLVSRALGNHRLAFETLKTYWQRVSLSVREHLGTTMSDWAVDWIKATVSWDDHALRDLRSNSDFTTAVILNAFRA